MRQLVLYGRLARVHSLQGAILLWCPTAYALWIAAGGMPPLHMVIFFLIGVFCMRSAGCVINDIADRHIDQHVTRTSRRPLASGEVTLIQALGLLCFFLAASLMILLQLSAGCFPYAILALVVAISYPLAKRFIKAPQLVLGVAFSMGIPIAYRALGHPFDGAMASLFLINFLWILLYDTQYALSDYMDDLKVKIHSTAILLKNYDRWVIGLLQIMVHGAWGLWGIIAHWGMIFWIMWCLALGVFIYQQQLLKINKYLNGFKAFETNCWYGVALWIGIIGAYYRI